MCSTNDKLTSNSPLDMAKKKLAEVNYFMEIFSTEFNVISLDVH
jgi:hypothetical protein